MVLLIGIIDGICIALFLLGFLGNLLGLMVFSSRRFRRCSTYAVLALASFTINLICVVRYSLLIHSTTRRWLSTHIVSEHWLSCKVFRLSSSFRVLAAWVTVFWVVERFTHVFSRLNFSFYRPGKYAIVDKYKYHFMICISLIIIIIVTGPTVLFFTPNSTSNNGTLSAVQCTFDINQTSSIWQSYFRDLSFGLNYHTIRFFFSELIPSCLVAVFNIAIIICVLRTTAHVRRRRQQHEEYHHNHQFLMSMMTRTTSKLPLLQLYDASQQRCVSVGGNSFGPLTTPIVSIPFGKMSWMNIVLFLHSLLFFVSSSITSLVYFSTSDMKVASWLSVIILANCSLNFYVYCLSGKLFRTELKRIAKRHMRNCHKRILRRCYKRTNDRRHSNIQNGKEQIYQTPIR